MSTYIFIVEILPKLEHDWEVALDDNNSSSDQWEITNLEFRDRIMDTMRVFHDLYENNTIVNLSEEMQELKHYWGNRGSPELSLEKLSEAKRWGLKTLYILRELNAGLATKIKQERYAEISNYVNKEAQTFKQVEHTISDIIASNGSTIETYTATISVLNELAGTIHNTAEAFAGGGINSVDEERFSLKEIEHGILDWIESYQPTPENYFEVIIFLKELRQKLHQTTESLFIKARELIPQPNLTDKYEWTGTWRPRYVECTRCGIHEPGEEVIGGICRVCWSDPD